MQPVKNHGIPSPYAIICYDCLTTVEIGCGRVYLTEAEYLRQLSRPDSCWMCPRCGACPVDFDDLTFERYFDEHQEGESPQCK